MCALGFVPGVVHDTILLSRLLHGTRHAKGFHGLEECVARELGRTLDKRHQKSDWSGELTADQLAYAILDAAVLVPLYETLDAKVREAGIGRQPRSSGGCLPAIAWLSEVGVGFDAGMGRCGGGGPRRRPRDLPRRWTRQRRPATAT